jgi:hypothetical protein
VGEVGANIGCCASVTGVLRGVACFFSVIGVSTPFLLWPFLPSDAAARPSELVMSYLKKKDVNKSLTTQHATIINLYFVSIFTDFQKCKKIK